MQYLARRIGDKLEEDNQDLKGLGNLTAVNLERTFPSQRVSSYLAAYPGNVPADEKPTISNLNMPEGAAVPNASLP